MQTIEQTALKPNHAWHTNQIEGATHIIDDGMIYWSVTPEMTSDQVAEAFRLGYDGTLVGGYDVTDIRTGLVLVLNDSTPED